MFHTRLLILPATRSGFPSSVNNLPLLPGKQAQTPRVTSDRCLSLTPGPPDSSSLCGDQRPVVPCPLHPISSWKINLPRQLHLHLPQTLPVSETNSTRGLVGAGRGRRTLPSSGPHPLWGKLGLARKHTDSRVRQTSVVSLSP